MTNGKLEVERIPSIHDMTRGKRHEEHAWSLPPRPNSSLLSKLEFLS